MIFRKISVNGLIVLMCVFSFGWVVEADQTPPPTYTSQPTPSPTPWPFTTIYVPLDFATIQEALNQAVAHTKILVMPGVYNENLEWPESGGIRLSG